MAKFCETCKQPYPDSLASCPNCDAEDLFKSLSLGAAPEPEAPPLESQAALPHMAKPADHGSPLLAKDQGSMPGAPAAGGGKMTQLPSSPVAKPTMMATGATPKTMMAPDDQRDALDLPPGEAPPTGTNPTMMAGAAKATMLAAGGGPKSTILAPADQAGPMPVPEGSPKGTMLATGSPQPTMLAKTGQHTQLAPPGQAGPMNLPPEQGASLAGPQPTLLAKTAPPTMLTKSSNPTQLAPPGQAGPLPLPPGAPQGTMLAKGAAQPTMLAKAAHPTQLMPDDEAGAMDLPPEAQKKTQLAPRVGSTVLAPPEEAGPMDLPGSLKKTMLPARQGSTILAPEDDVTAEVDTAEVARRSSMMAPVAVRPPSMGEIEVPPDYAPAPVMTAPRPIKKSGTFGGAVLGILLGTAACVALLFSGLLPASVLSALGLQAKTAAKDGDLSGLELARYYLVTGQFQKAIDTTGTSTEPGMVAVRGEARWLKFRQDNASAKDLKRTDPAVEEAIREMTEANAGAKNARCLYHLGEIEEVFKSPDKARDFYQEGKKAFPKEEQFFDSALIRLELAAPPAKPAADARPRDADRMALLAMMLVAQAGDAPAVDNKEAGFKFWQSALAAKKGDFKAAEDALKEAIKRHETRRFQLLRKPQNPESDPNEAIFLRAANDLLEFYKVQAALKSAGVLADRSPSEAVKALAAGQKDPEGEFKKLLAAAKEKLGFKADPTAEEVIKELERVEVMRKGYEALQKELADAKLIKDDADLKDVTKALQEAVAGKIVADKIAKRVKDAGIDEADTDKAVGLIITDRDEADKLIKDAIKELEENGYLGPKSGRKEFLAGVTRAIDAGRSPLVSALARTAASLGNLGNDATIRGIRSVDLAGSLAAAKEDVIRLNIILGQVRTPIEMLDFWLPLMEKRERKQVMEGAARDARRVLDDKGADAATKAQAKAILGMVQRNEGKFDEARETLAEALKVKAAGKEAFWRKAALHVQKELTDPNYYYLPTAERLAGYNNFDEALKVLDIGTAAFPADGRLLALRSQVALDQAIATAKATLTAKDPLVDQARKDAAAAIKAGAIAEGNYAAGRVAEELGRREDAETYYRNALQAHPRNDLAGSRYRVALGRVLSAVGGPRRPPVNNANPEKGPMPKAGAMLPVSQPKGQAALPRDAAAVIALFTTALAAGDDDVENKDFDDAIQLGEDAIRAGNPEGYLIKGIALARKGNFTEGLKEYTEGLRRLIKPQFADGLYYIVDNHPSFQLPDALRVPDLVQGEKHYAAGLRAYFAGQYALAERELLEAYRNQPNDARYLYYLGLSRAAQGKRAAAIDNFQRGWLLERQNKPGAAAVGAALERVQGPARQTVNAYRQ